MVRGEAVDCAIWKPEMLLEEMARHAVDFWLTFEGLPDAANRVSYDSWGRSVLSLKQVNWEPHKRLRANLEHLGAHMGCHHLLPRHLYLDKRSPVGGTAHQCGTVRLGTAGAGNPDLTIIAGALRVGHHLLERLR